MTFRAEISAGTPVGAIVLPLPQPRPRPLAEGFLAAVTERASALYFDTDAAPARRRVAVAADGAPLPGPLVSTTLPLSAGGCRHVVLLGHRVTCPSDHYTPSARRKVDTMRPTWR